MEDLLKIKMFIDELIAERSKKKVSKNGIKLIEKALAEKIYYLGKKFDDPVYNYEFNKKYRPNFYCHVPDYVRPHLCYHINLNLHYQKLTRYYHDLGIELKTRSNLLNVRFATN